jgi:site-specific recombinase XerD
VRATDNQIQIKDKNALFLSSRNQRISNKTVQYIVYKYLKLAGLEYKHFSTHKLRHTAATLMYQTGKVDVRVLKDILGHEQLNTTQIYTHVSDESMEKAMQNNPLNALSKKKNGS